MARRLNQRCFLNVCSGINGYDQSREKTKNGRTKYELEPKLTLDYSLSITTDTLIFLSVIIQSAMLISHQIAGNVCETERTHRRCTSIAAAAAAADARRAGRSLVGVLGHRWWGLVQYWSYSARWLDWRGFLRRLQRHTDATETETT